MADLLSQTEIDAFLNSATTEESEETKKGTIETTINETVKIFKVPKPQSLRFTYPKKPPVTKTNQIIVTENEEEYNEYEKSARKDPNYNGKGEIVVFKPNY